jgi:hypothetical protein
LAAADQIRVTDESIYRSDSVSRNKNAKFGVE